MSDGSAWLGIENETEVLFTELPRRVEFSETLPTDVCSVVHEYSDRVTSGSKPK